MSSSARACAVHVGRCRGGKRKFYAAVSSRLLGWVGQAGNQFGGGVRDEAQWDAILEAVKEFKRTHGRFPRRSGGDADETRLYDWLKHNMNTTSNLYTHERANKLVLAFGDRWQSECFKKSIWAW